MQVRLQECLPQASCQRTVYRAPDPHLDKASWVLPVAQDAIGKMGSLLSRFRFPESQSALETLPFDILFEISQYLDFRSILHISSTCRILREKIDPLLVASHSTKVAFFLEVERYPQYNDTGRLACFRCWKLLPKDYFGTNQTKNRMGKNSASWKPLIRCKRFCWDCGARDRLYLEQRGIRKGGYLWYLCYECGEYKLKSQRCVQEETDEEGNVILVKRCGKSTKSRPSTIEQLPSGIMKRILEPLKYKDCIMLSQTNRYFKALVTPQNCAIRDKFLFVRKISSEKKADFLPCYCCFRVRRREKFTTEHQQLARKDRFKIVRKCRECLSRSHQPTVDGRAMLERIKLMEYCVNCRELKYRSETCFGCYEKYCRSRVSGESLRRQRKVIAEYRRQYDPFDELDLSIATLWYREQVKAF